MAKTYEIREIGGNCPVQAEGKIGGKTDFYFRARGSHWSMSISPSHGDVVGKPEWYYEEDYGVWPDAGWMEESEARAFIDKSIKLYWGKTPSMS